MKIFVINLKKDIEKKEKFIKTFEPIGLDYEFIEGIYGRGLSEDELRKSVYDYDNCFITKGEVGCALSHLKIYQKIVDENIPYALILEDDTVFNSEFRNYLNILQVFLQTKQNYELVCLMYMVNSFKNFNIKINKEITLYKFVAGTGTYGYIITNAAAKKMLKANTPLILEADCWLQFYKLCGLNIYGLNKNIIETSDIDGTNSSIEKERVTLGKKKSRARKQRMRKFGGVAYILRGLWYRLLKTIFSRHLISK
ncbi:glycosyltransferase family 25 protein [Campylobacter suis]|uniref:Glycosyl transferase family 25 domain-containing protein n=1 Tax=Campylobacter suis TaxID=2790657 RepID=A0ABM8Q130_9BACT|nr:glycosyltransferase family 25 protein [Campylobacter suis]CAD7286476.1 hypothetical protein LMG8286_00309 [Campylobacter suis]